MSALREAPADRTTKNRDLSPDSAMSSLLRQPWTGGRDGTMFMVRWIALGLL